MERVSLSFYFTLLKYSTMKSGSFSKCLSPSLLSPSCMQGRELQSWQGYCVHRQEILHILGKEADGH